MGNGFHCNPHESKKVGELILGPFWVFRNEMGHNIATVSKSCVLSLTSKIITTELDSEDTRTSSVRSLQLLLGLPYLRLGCS